jgi:hypothetical protein
MVKGQRFTVYVIGFKSRLSDPFKTPPNFGQSQPSQMTSRPIKKGSANLHVTRRQNLKLNVQGYATGPDVRM